MYELKVIDFFCGGGGFSEGFRQAGFKVIWAVDNWRPAVNTHKENHPDCETICDDVIRLSLLPDKEFNRMIPDSEIIVGSPPCTSFSNSNRSGNGDKTKGLELIKAYLRIIARKKNKPGSILKYWILENVPKVKNHIKDQYTAKELDLDGTSVLSVKSANSSEYNAKYFGVPSNRIRYFCGDFPTPEAVIDADKDLIPLKSILNALGAPKEKLHSNICDPIYGTIMKGEDVSDHHYVQELSEFEITKIIRLKQDKGFMGRMAVPENPEKPARTIMATMSFTSRECFVLGNYPGTLRAPSIREVATLMSFPIDYRFYGNSLGAKYRMVGNAVPPKISFAFANAILKAEKIKIEPFKYSPIKHAHRIAFLNLNLDEIPIKEEKRKNVKAKFKYHIPYYKFDTYRVELTNHRSDLANLEFIWTAEIHYSQGKDRAKVYVPNMKNIEIEKALLKRADLFFTLILNKIVTFNQFQGIHIQTIDEVRDGDLIGPYEVLGLIRDFIDAEFMFAKDNKEKCNLSEAPYELPKPIVLGYYILNKFVNLMALKNEQRSKNKRIRENKELANAL